MKTDPKDQMTLFGSEPPAPTGETLKKKGIKRALENVDDEWKRAFEYEASKLALSGVEFTSEDVTARVSLPRGRTGMNRNNAVGAMMQALAKRGMIRKTGGYRKSTVPSSHSAILAIWVGRIKKVGA